jgi:hypothetical protein
MKMSKSDFNEEIKDEFEDNLTDYRIRQREPAMLRPDYSRIQKKEEVFYSQPMLKIEEEKAKANGEKTPVVINSSNGQVIANGPQETKKPTTNAGAKAAVAAVAAILLYNQLG